VLEFFQELRKTAMQGKGLLPTFDERVDSKPQARRDYGTELSEHAGSKVLHLPRQKIFLFERLKTWSFF
jgi:hypothetical protein